MVPHYGDRGLSFGLPPRRAQKRGQSTEDSPRLRVPRDCGRSSEMNQACSRLCDLSLRGSILVSSCHDRRTRGGRNSGANTPEYRSIPRMLLQDHRVSGRESSQGGCAGTARGTGGQNDGCARPEQGRLVSRSETPLAPIPGSALVRDRRGDTSSLRWRKRGGIFSRSWLGSGVSR